MSIRTEQTFFLLYKIKAREKMENPSTYLENERYHSRDALATIDQTTDQRRTLENEETTKMMTSPKAFEIDSNDSHHPRASSNNDLDHLR